MFFLKSNGAVSVCLQNAIQTGKVGYVTRFQGLIIIINRGSQKNGQSADLGEWTEHKICFGKQNKSDIKNEGSACEDTQIEVVKLNKKNTNKALSF